MRVAIGTRFFDNKNPEKNEVIKQFVENARRCAPYVLVAVNEAIDITNAIEVVNSLGLEGVKAFGVKPWGKFVMPLNALILEAAALKAEGLLLASAEVELTPEIVSALESRMQGDVLLVVGAAMVGHSLGDGAMEGNGVTVPWNTCALWNLKYLSATGFPLIGDAPFDPSQAGVEEVTAIALSQQLNPSLEALLVEIPGLEWDTSNFDPERLAKHQKKMESKVTRPAAQMAVLTQLFPGTEPPFVFHIR